MFLGYFTDNTCERKVDVDENGYDTSSSADEEKENVNDSSTNNHESSFDSNTSIQDIKKRKLFALRRFLSRIFKSKL